MRKDLVLQEVDAGRLSFSEATGAAVSGADTVFICVGTPPRAGGESNLVAMESSVRTVAREAFGRLLKVEKSTVPVGTAARVKQVLRNERPDLVDQLEVASNPEFLREGRAVEDSLAPDRILVGADSQWALETLRSIFEPLTRKGCRLIETDIATAELAKHACNAFLALKISFINALARVTERSGANVVDVADIMGADPRIGPAFLDAGIGFGGSCFPKDLKAFDRFTLSLGYEFPILREIERINDEAVTAAVEKVREALWNVEG